jgi:drug/metabolite transporter (DMT)-like permease
MATYGERLAALTHGGTSCNETATGETVQSSGLFETEKAPTSFFAAGVTLSMLADVLIAASMGVRKLAHNRNSGPDGKPLKRYTALPLFWVGAVLGTVGEFGNVLAYGMAPACVVSVVGSVGVLANEVFAVVFLKEPLRRRDVLGLVRIVAGVVLVVVAIPKASEHLDVHELLSTHVVFAPRTYWYLIFLLMGVVFFVIVLEPRFAHESMLVWLLLCASISSVGVMAVRGWASLVTQIPTDCGRTECVHGVVHQPCDQTIGHWLFWVLLTTVVLCATYCATDPNPGRRSLLLYAGPPRCASRAAAGRLSTSTRRCRSTAMWRSSPSITRPSPSHPS